MKNLKQVLALGMAFSLTMSTMAGAAFTDSADIKATEAVDMLSALGVIKGYEDGSFKPEGTVTRAEAAKMIYTIRNGGNDDASSWASLPTTFTDLNGYGWAEGYIKYCQSMNIIAGKSATKFDPGAQVTGVELAKMMLVTLGYNPETAGLVGATWSTKTLGLAGENGLLDDVNSDLAAGLPRQYAAQLLYNAVLAPTVVVRDGQYTNMTYDGKTYNPTIGGKYMGLQEWVGKFTATDKTDAGLKDGQITVNGASFTYKFDIANLGQEVSVLYKDGNNGTDNKPDDKDTIYGIYVTGNTTVINATVADIDKISNTVKVKVSGKEYTVAETGKIYNNHVEVTGTQWSSKRENGKTAIEKLKSENGNAIKVVLNDKNEVETVYVSSTELYKVTAVSGSKVSISGIGTIDTSKNDTVVYKGIAKDDVVAVSALYKDIKSVDDATYVIKKAETVSGKLTAFSNKDAEKTKTLTVDGTVYKVYNEAAMKSGLTDDSITVANSDLIDTTVTLYMVNGYVYAAQKSVEEAKLYAIVNAVDENGVLGSTFKTPKVELILADGTKKTVTLHKDSKIYAGTGDTYTTTKDEIKGNLASGQLVKYVEMSNGEYKIEECGDYDNGTKNALYNKDTKTFDGFVTSGDCVLFYTDANGDLKATNIRSLGNIDINSKNYAKVVKDGKVVAAYVALNTKPSGASATTLYGIVSSDVSTTSKGGDTYNMYTIATNEGDVSVYLPTSETLSKGQIVSFDRTSDDTYSKATEFTKYTDGAGNAQNGIAVAVTNYNEGDKTITYATSMSYDGSAYTADTKTTKAVDDKVKISYINAADDKAGDSGFGVNEYDATTGYANAILVFEDGDTDKKVVAIIVNTNGDKSVTDTTDPALKLNKVMPNTSKVSDVTSALSDSKVSGVTITGDFTLDSALTVPKGKTLTINGNVKGAYALTATAGSSGSDLGATIVVTGSVANNVTANAYTNVTVGDVAGAITDAANANLTITGKLTGTFTSVNGTVTMVAAQTAAKLEAMTPASGAKLILKANSEDATSNKTAGAGAKFWAKAGSTGSENGTVSIADTDKIAAGNYEYVANAYYQSSTTADASVSNVWVISAS